MSLSLDWLLLLIAAAVLVILTIRGYTRGFLKTVLSVASIVLSLFLVTYLQPTVKSVILQATTLRPAVERVVQQGVEGEFQKAFLSGSEGQTNAEAQKALEDEEVLKGIRLTRAQQTQLLGVMDVPEVLRQEIQTSVETTAAAFLQTVTRVIADTVVSAVSYLATFLLVFLLIRIIYAVFGVIEKVPVLSGINKTLGGILGLAEGLVILWLLCLLVTAIFPSGLGRKIMEAINHNQILSYVYNILFMLGNLFRK